MLVRGDSFENRRFPGGSRSERLSVCVMPDRHTTNRQTPLVIICRLARVLAATVERWSLLL
jgi:hypothetical protein